MKIGDLSKNCGSAFYPFINESLDECWILLEYPGISLNYSVSGLPRKNPAWKNPVLFYQDLNWILIMKIFHSFSKSIPKQHDVSMYYICNRSRPKRLDRLSWTFIWEGVWLNYQFPDPKSGFLGQGKSGWIHFAPSFWISMA